jgi:hypothetical protein
MAALEGLKLLERFEPFDQTQGRLRAAIERGFGLRDVELLSEPLNRP